MSRFNSMRLLRLSAIVLAAALGMTQQAAACTGISFVAKDGSKVIGRTMEWGTFPMESHLVVIPRGYSRLAVTPSGVNGMRLVAKYGYTGIGVLADNFLTEGVNEKGLVGELFYFPHYGKCEDYDSTKNSVSVTDAQFLEWVLGSFATVDEMVENLDKIRLVGFGGGFETAHFNIADASGHHVVVEYYDGRFHVHENEIGVITNSPSFDWHMTNLNNYINLFSGVTPPRELPSGVKLQSFGMGSAALGLPGDLTPPSRFVRAAFYVQTARPQETGFDAVLQTFQILNNFDIPIGAEFTDSEEMPDMLSATQWTTAIDTKALKLYYRTEWNSTIRCVDLNEIDFGRVEYQALPLDKVQQQPIEYVKFE